MKSLMSLLQCILADASIWCCTSTTLNDYKTIQRRVEHEGISFLTISLPMFASDFEKSLDVGIVSPSSFSGFRKTGAIPTLLSGMLELVFDSSSGRLLDNPSVVAIFFIRQTCLTFKKIYLPCSTEREEAAFHGYIECDREVGCRSGRIPADLYDQFGYISDHLFSTVFSRIDRKAFTGDLVPRHGPGNTADRISGNRKFDHTAWTQRLEGSFPSLDFLVPNMGFYKDLDAVNFLEPDAEIPVRVVSVPKTLKTPRIIAMEPLCMQYAQQSLLREFVSELESSDKLRGSIGFTDQVPNQRLAQLGSISCRLATIDLSEASDRVSNQLVTRLFKNFPHLANAVSNCRSTKADVPGYGIHTISKFASMGSALCFPVEAMVFLTIILYGYSMKLNRRLTEHDYEVILGQVRVYGDDIIVPVDIVRYVVISLELYGFKINASKSFWTGKFRESCGKDYYDGQDVSVTYVRRMFPSRHNNVSEMISLVSLRNQFYFAGLWETVKYLDNLLGRIANFPVVLATSPVLGRHSFLGYQTQRICRHLHAPLVRGYVVTPKPRPSKLDGYGALLKFFLLRGLDPIKDKNHLEHCGRPESVNIKLRWASPF